jgi:hypothetical protein
MMYRAHCFMVSSLTLCVHKCARVISFSNTEKVDFFSFDTRQATDHFKKNVRKNRLGIRRGIL